MDKQPVNFSSLPPEPHGPARALGITSLCLCLLAPILLFAVGSILLAELTIVGALALGIVSCATARKQGYSKAWGLTGLIVAAVEVVLEIILFIAILFGSLSFFADLLKGLD